ncbi:hypothetical protein GCM10025734_19360 [Kitasatospora paranensis]|uniref:SDR family oxidoreductase n=1 Tax=Kitasatospora paranensis TaxID=258053 RepID=UPI0031EF960D
MDDTRSLPRPTALVLGAGGFLGRWLTLELLRRGRTVAVGLRGGPAREAELRRWLGDHGADETELAALTGVTVDITRPGLGLSRTDESALSDVQDVHNLAARYAFGLSRAEARAANLDGAVHTLNWAAGRPGCAGSSTSPATASAVRPRPSTRCRPPTPTVCTGRSARTRRPRPRATPPSGSSPRSSGSR